MMNRVNLHTAVISNVFMIFTFVSFVLAAPAGKTVKLSAPIDATGASIEHDTNFQSFSIEPAFWPEFFGNKSSPNKLAFDLLRHITDRGVTPIIRPGGDTMDSMNFDPNGPEHVRDTGSDGTVYKTTVGPDYFRSWENFPKSIKFIATLDLNNASLQIASDMAAGAVKYSKDDRIYVFSLGNEPDYYPADFFGTNDTANYVAMWLNYTEKIDAVINQTSIEVGKVVPAKRRWLSSSSSSSTRSSHRVGPKDIIPLGIDRNGQIKMHSIHSYPFNSCTQQTTALATLSSISNHTNLITIAEANVLPHAKAALAIGEKWTLGEFNSIACSGKPNVSDTFAQALWAIDTSLIFAVNNASTIHLHSGATLVSQSSDQLNTVSEGGAPGFSSYDIFYPRNSSLRGEARSNPGYLSQLFLAEALVGNAKSRVLALDVPKGASADRFSAYAFYDKTGSKGPSRIAVLNMEQRTSNLTQTEQNAMTLNIDISSILSSAGVNFGKVYVKRLAAPYLDTKDSSKTTWAGQSFKYGKATGKLNIEQAEKSVTVKGGEAVLIFVHGKPFDA